MKKYKIPLSVLCLAIAIVSSFFAGQWYSGVRVDEQMASHNLLAKRLFLTQPNDILVNFEPLRATLRTDLAYYDGKMSLYFEYLPTGTSIRQGDANRIVAASLLKVPAVMELYKLSAQGRVNLNDRISLKKEWLDSNYGDLYMKGAGYTTTIRELAKITLEKSDNTALNAIQSVVKERATANTTNAYDALDVDHNANDDQQNLTMTARSYASFLKCLYFACYNTIDSSQELMTYLDHSTEGEAGMIGKYIPNTVSIAHKIGIAGNEAQSDCGIIYVPNRNYLLCIMLDEEKVRGGEVIAQTSKTVYDYVTGIK